MADVATMRVGLVSPERALWEGEAEAVFARTLSGELGVLPGHIPLLGVLSDGGVVRIEPGDGKPPVVVAVNGGFLSVTADGVSILAETAEFADEIDVAAAQRDLDAAEAGSPEAIAAQGRLDAAEHAGRS
jgi:F-type H+-transporting ATPase subunit epsilon